ncbi:hypothetical protein LC040_06790 [Bacillus tianshenii]|nr:hypothetical protein LC040_06790 [Bacillus tianshenii]
MHPFITSVRFYSRNIESLLLLSVTLVLPFLLLYSTAMNHIYFYASISNMPLISATYNVAFIVWFLYIAQLPFARFVQSDFEGEENRLRSAYYTFFRYGFSVFLFGFFYMISVVVGMYLFIIPGMIVFVFFYITPCIVAFKNEPAWKCWNNAFSLGKKYFFPLLGLILLTGFIEWLISMAGLYGVMALTSKYNAVFITQLLLFIIVFPLIAVTFAVYTRNWAEETFLNHPIEKEGA